MKKEIYKSFENVTHMHTHSIDLNNEKINENNIGTNSISYLRCKISSNFMQKNKLANQNGITLIALIVTIVILIILAGLSINLVLGENGIIAKAKEQQEKQDIARILENLELEKDAVGIDNENTITLEKYIDFIKQKGIIINENILENNEKSALIVVEGKYVYSLEEENGNVKIEYNGKVNNLPPVIKVKNITNTTNKINIEVETRRNEEGKIEYYIKEENESEYQLKKTTQETTYSYENLEQNKKYNVKIVVVSGNGKTAEILVDRTVGQVQGLTNTNTTFTYSPDGWTNGNVTVTVSTTVEGYTLQTSKNGTDWETTNIQTYSENGPVYARLIDSTNQANGYAAGNIDKIEKNEPTLAINDLTTLNNTYRYILLTENEILYANLTISDNQSGINLNKSRWILTNSSNLVGNNPNSYTGGNIQNGTNSFGKFTKGDYYLHVLAIDNAGNCIEKVSEKIKIVKVEITNITTKGFDIYVYNVDPTVAYVQCPTWTEYNEQDDLSVRIENGIHMYEDAINLGNGTWYHRINRTDHKCETGVYRTDLYFRESDKNAICGYTFRTNVPNTISQEIRNLSSSGYDIYVYSPNTSYAEVRFPTWTEYNGQDDIAWPYPLGTSLGNGVWYFRVNKSAHNNESGLYYTHIYGYTGNQTGATFITGEVINVP